MPVDAKAPIDGAAAGAAVYSRFVLSLYDLEVLGFELPVVFGCPARRNLALYDRHSLEVVGSLALFTGQA